MTASWAMSSMSRCFDPITRRTAASIGAPTCATRVAAASGLPVAAA